MRLKEMREIAEARNKFNWQEKDLRMFFDASIPFTTSKGEADFCIAANNTYDQLLAVAEAAKLVCKSVLSHNAYEMQHNDYCQKLKLALKKLDE